MSSYRNQISCCVTDKVAADLSAAAEKREITVAALVRQAIVRELYFRKDPLPLMQSYVMFAVTALDELIRVQPDQGFRDNVHKIWRDWTVREGAPHVD